MNIQQYATKDCPECDGEGIIHYAIGDRDYTDVCDKCFPDGYDDSDDRYDAWRDSQC